MFIGIQNGKVVFAKNTKEELENIPCVFFDEIKETEEDWQLVNGEYRIGGRKTAEELRQERDWLLAETDKYMLPDFPISEEERNKYKQYRQYLRDLPQDKDFPNIIIKKI